MEMTPPKTQEMGMSSNSEPKLFCSTSLETYEERLFVAKQIVDCYLPDLKYDDRKHFADFLAFQNHDRYVSNVFGVWNRTRVDSLLDQLLEALIAVDEISKQLPSSVSEHLYYSSDMLEGTGNNARPIDFNPPLARVLDNVGVAIAIMTGPEEDGQPNPFEKAKLANEPKHKYQQNMIGPRSMAVVIEQSRRYGERQGLLADMKQIRPTRRGGLKSRYGTFIYECLVVSGCIRDNGEKPDIAMLSKAFNAHVKFSRFYRYLR